VSSLSVRQGMLDGSVMMYGVSQSSYYNATGSIGDHRYAYRQRPPKHRLTHPRRVRKGLKQLSRAGRSAAKDGGNETDTIVKKDPSSLAPASKFLTVLSVPTATAVVIPQFSFRTFLASTLNYIVLVPLKVLLSFLKLLAALLTSPPSLSLGTHLVVFLYLTHLISQRATAIKRASQLTGFKEAISSITNKNAVESLVWVNGVVEKAWRVDGKGDGDDRVKFDVDEFTMRAMKQETKVKYPNATGLVGVSSGGGSVCTTTWRARVQRYPLANRFLSAFFIHTVCVALVLELLFAKRSARSIRFQNTAPFTRSFVRACVNLT